MKELLQTYSLESIFTFIVLFALATKGCITFLEWALTKARILVKHVDEPAMLRKSIQMHESQIKEIRDSIKELTGKVDMLIDSDRDDIKAYITRQHHYFVYQKKWIDDYSLNCIEKRYSHYERQGGNSFMKDLMYEIRQLPKQPPAGTDQEYQDQVLKKH